MSSFRSKDGTHLYFKDWGSADDLAALGEKLEMKEVVHVGE
jgi:hypothetical protein